MWHSNLSQPDWLLVCILMGVTAVPLALRLVPPNAFYGFRTSFTRGNREGWYAVNAATGWAMLLGSIVSAGILMWEPYPASQPWWPAVVVLVPVALALLAGLVALRQARESAARR